jgi:hypothetical protein
MPRWKPKYTEASAMKHPSTGNAGPAGSNDPRDSAGDHPAGNGNTRTSVDGEKSPRLPNERDESPDTGNKAPSKQMHIARKDAESSKVPTDKSTETNDAYSRLRGRTPGNERDQGGA